MLLAVGISLWYCRDRKAKRRSSRLSQQNLISAGHIIRMNKSQDLGAMENARIQEEVNEEERRKENEKQVAEWLDRELRVQEEQRRRSQETLDEILPAGVRAEAGHSRDSSTLSAPFEPPPSRIPPTPSKRDNRSSSQSQNGGGFCVVQRMDNAVAHVN